MKFRITFKDPDGVSDSINEEALNLAQNALSDTVKADENLLEKLIQPLLEHYTEDIKSKIDKWIEYSEYVTIEFDTDANTCTVVPV